MLLTWENASKICSIQITLLLQCIEVIDARKNLELKKLESLSAIASSNSYASLVLGNLPHVSITQ